MDYNLLKVAQDKVLEQALTTRGNTRKGFAHIHIPSADAADEHVYFDLRGLGRHQQKFRNWCKREFADREYAIYFGGGA